MTSTCSPWQRRRTSKSSTKWPYSSEEKRCTQLTLPLSLFLRDLPIHTTKRLTTSLIQAELLRGLLPSFLSKRPLRYGSGTRRLYHWEREVREQRDSLKSTGTPLSLVSTT